MLAAAVSPFAENKNYQDMRNIESTSPKSFILYGREINGNGFQPHICYENNWKFIEIYLAQIGY